MQTEMTLLSRFHLRDRAQTDARSGLAGSGLVLALLALAYWLSNYVLSGRVSPDLNFYLIRPVIWGLTGLTALVLWRRLSERPRPSRLLLGLSALAAAFSISALVCTGVLFGFGHSPYAHRLLNIAENLWYLSAFIFGLEMSRAYLLTVWSRYNSGLAFVAVSLLIAAMWIAPVQYRQMLQGSDLPDHMSRLVAPGIAESLLLSFLASLGGPLPAIVYHLSLEAFRWVSPILPRMQWELALLVGTLTPSLAMLIIRDAFFARPEEQEAPAGAKEKFLSPVVLTLATIIVGLIWLNTGMLGVQPALVSGPSMKPYLGPGDIVIVKDVDPASIKVGDIVQFREGSREVIHRVTSVNRTPRGVTVQTQGDNNNVADAPLSLNQIEGKVVLKVPLVGWVPIKLRELVY